jgi:BASS family bile acid:Na+ symporter
LAVVTRASTPVLAVMIGSISLALSVEQFRDIDARTLGLVLAGYVTIPFSLSVSAKGSGCRRN